ncbi:MAG: NADH-quinone oxidoreductase subunit K [Desulfurivibrionaceae bacterium]
MTTDILYSFTGLALFFFGFFALIAYFHPLRKILAINVMATGVFLCLMAISHSPGKGHVDPVPQAMILTGIVVSVSTTALALILACRIQETSASSRLLSRQPEKSEERAGRQ